MFIFGSLELRRTTFVSGEYERSTATVAPYLFGGGARLARVYYAEDDVPTLSSGHRHVLFELPDHLGSASFVVDKDTSELVEATRYQAYGGIDSDYRAERWSSYREDYRFTGKEEDIEVGLSYFGARYLAPALNRWISADPLALHGLSADLDLYAYVHGRPLRAIDLWGLHDIKVDDHGGYELVTMDADTIKAEPTRPNSDTGYAAQAVGQVIAGDVAGAVETVKQGAAQHETRQAEAMVSPLLMQLETNQRMADSASRIALAGIDGGLSGGQRGATASAGEQALNEIKTQAGWFARRLPVIGRWLAGDDAAERRKAAKGPISRLGAIGDEVEHRGAAVGEGAALVVGARSGVGSAAAEEIGAGGGGGPNIVYRGLAPGENPAAGLVARAPGAGNSIASHVAGARVSQWISATKSLDVARSRFGANGVVAIDLSKVGSPIVDLAAGIPGIGRNTMLSRWAINAQEVVIQGRIPAEAIKPVP